MWEHAFKERLQRRVVIVTGVVQSEYEQQLIECNSEGTEESEPTVVVPVVPKGTGEIKLVDR